jgi:aquaporin Z
MVDSLPKYLAEVFGTFTLVFVGSVAILATEGAGGGGYVEIGFAFGLALLAGLYAFAEVSGGHFNPIVSLAMVLDRRLDARDLAGYWIAQFAGAVLASICVLIAFDQDAVGRTATKPGPTGAGTALFLEILVSAIFVLVILQSTKSERHGGTALLAIPLTLAAAHFALIPFSGSSLNTARSFGPALIGTEWTDFWVYVIGPPLGAVIGWAVYAIVVKGAGTETAAQPQPPPVS